MAEWTLELEQKAKEACEKATAGPWYARGELVSEDGSLVLRMEHGRGHQDFGFIALARTALPAAIAELDARQATIETLGGIAREQDKQLVELRRANEQLLAEVHDLRECYEPKGTP